MNFANLSQVRETKRENYNFVHLLYSSSSLTCIARKLYSVCRYYAYQITALLPGILLFWFEMVYKLPLASYSDDTVPQCTRLSLSEAYVASAYEFRAWHV